MLRACAFCGFALILIGLVCSTASANIVGTPNCGPDTDGVMKCDPAGWATNGDGTYTLTIKGKQYCVEGNGPLGVTGHVLGDFTTDTEQDPTVKMYNSIDNDTALTWTDYHINITMSKLFSISNAAVDDAIDWSTVMTQPTPNGDGTYTGHVDYNYYPVVGVNTIAPGGTFDFHYWITFVGSVSYTQEMLPSVPEPMTLSMIALGGLALLRRRGR